MGESCVLGTVPEPSAGTTDAGAAEPALWPHAICFLKNQWKLRDLAVSGWALLMIQYASQPYKIVFEKC